MLLESAVIAPHILRHRADAERTCPCFETDKQIGKTDEHSGDCGSRCHEQSHRAKRVPHNFRAAAKHLLSLCHQDFRANFLLIVQAHIKGTIPPMNGIAKERIKAVQKFLFFRSGDPVAV